MAGTVTTNTKKYYGGLVPEPTPQGGGDGKTKVLVLRDVTVTVDEHPVTKKLLCDPDSVITAEPFIEVVTAEKLAEWLDNNYVILLDDGTQQVQMLKASVSTEGETPVCNSVVFKGLKDSKRASIEYPCQLLTDESTLTNFIEAGAALVQEFNLVSAYPEDTTSGTLIDKLEIEDTIDDDPDYQPLLEIVPTDGKVAINEDRLHEALDGLGGAIDGVIETIDELDMDSVPHAYLHSTLNQSAGDSSTTRTTVDIFACNGTPEGDCFEFEQTTTIDDTPYGYLWVEPGTYLINGSVTLQWVGNPRGTFVAKVGSVMGENFDFSQEQEILRNHTKIVTIPNRMKLAINITYDAGTPVMGFWIQSLQVVKLAGGMSQTTVAHGLSLEGNGSVENPLGISEHGLREAFDYAKNKAYFATKQELVPLATNAALQAETSRATQRENEIETLFTLPTQEAVDVWLNAHPEATTTVQDGSLTIEKFASTLQEQTQNIEVTPEMYGAVGDGITDDTSAFAAAIGQSSLANRVIIKGHTGKRYKIRNLVVRNVTIKNCVFLPVQEDDDGILLRGQSVIEDCFFSSFNKAISITETCVNSFVIHNIIQYSKTGIYINVVGNNSVNSVKIIGNYIINSGSTQSAELPEEDGCGIYANGKFCGLFIAYNILELSRKHGITLYNNESAIVSAVVCCNCFEQNYGIAVHINILRQTVCMVSVTGNFFSNYAAADVSVQNFGVVFDSGYSTYPVVDNVGRCFASFKYSDGTFKSCESGSHYYRFDRTSLFTPTTSEFYTVQAKLEKPHVVNVNRYVRIKYYASLSSAFKLIEYSATVRHTFEQGFNDVIIPFVPQWRFNRALVDDEFLIIYDYSLVN